MDEKLELFANDDSREFLLEMYDNLDDDDPSCVLLQYIAIRIIMLNDGGKIARFDACNIWIENKYC